MSKHEKDTGKISNSSSNIFVKGFIGLICVSIAALLAYAIVIYGQVIFDLLYKLTQGPPTKAAQNTAYQLTSIIGVPLIAWIIFFEYKNNYRDKILGNISNENVDKFYTFICLSILVLALAAIAGFFANAVVQFLFQLASFAFANTLNKPTGTFEGLRNIVIVLTGLVGLPFIIWRTILADRQTRTAEEKTKLDEQTHYTTLYTKSIELLGATRVAKDSTGNDVSVRAMELRLGAIYALERIARDSWKDHWPIMEVLTAYIRESSPYKKDAEPEPITTDIQAAITVIGRRKEEWIEKEVRNGQRLDLSRCNLTGANINRLNLSYTNFKSSSFLDTSIQNSEFKDANFNYCQFGCSTSETHNLNYTDFSYAIFHLAKVSNITFSNCNLSNSRFGLKEINQLKFYKCDINTSNFDYTKAVQIVFERCNLYSTRLGPGSCENIDFNESILCSTRIITITKNYKYDSIALILDTQTKLGNLELESTISLDFIATKSLADNIYGILKHANKLDEVVIEDIWAVIDKHHI